MAKKQTSKQSQTETQETTDTQASTDETKTEATDPATTEQETQTAGGDGTTQETEPTTQTGEDGAGTEPAASGDETGGGTEPTASGDDQQSPNDDELGDPESAEPAAAPVGDEAVKQLVEEAPEDLKSIAYQLGEYIDAMRPNKGQTGDSLHKSQLKLRGVVNAVLQLPDEKFDEGMKFLVGAVRAYRDDVFSERFIFRGFPQLRISRPERQKLETLISLLLATADSKSPKTVSKTVDLNVVLRYVNDNNQQQKLQSYYGE